MARLLISGTKKYSSWSFDLCEEVVLIDAYLKLKSIMPLHLNPWLQEFEFYQFEKGTPINTTYLDHINTKLKQYKYEQVPVRESAVFGLARERDQSHRAYVRRQLRDDLEVMDSARRRDYVEKNRAEADALPPPHYTAAEYQQVQQRRLAEQNASREQTAAHLALEAHRRAEAEKKARELDIDSALVLITATDDEALRREIVTRLPKPVQLQILAASEDQAIKNLIVSVMLQ